MQLSTHHAVHPHLVPVTEGLGGQDINTVLGAAILAVAAGALGLDLSTEPLDGGRLGLGAS